MNRTVRLIVAAIAISAFMLGVMIAFAGNMNPAHPAECNDYPAGSCTHPVVPEDGNVVVREAPVPVIANPRTVG